MSDNVYRDILLDHFRHPRNKGELDDDMVRERGSNPRCGDDLEVGVVVKDAVLDRVRFHGRGCSVCMASASMMTEVCQGKHTDTAKALCAELETWVSARKGGGEAPDPGLDALDGARAHAARHTCILLAWRALSGAIDKHS